MALSPPLRLPSPGGAMPPGPIVPNVPQPVAAPRPAPAAPAPKRVKYDTKLKLSDKEKETLGRSIKHKITVSTQARRYRDDRIREWRDMYDNLTYPKNWPWPNAASLSIPTIRTATDTIHARMLRASVSTTPLFRVEAFNQASQDVASKIEGILQWQMNDQMEIASAWDKIYMGGLRDGTGVGKLCWKREIARMRSPGVEKDAYGQPVMVNGKPIPVLIEQDEYAEDRPDLEPIDVLDFMMYPHNAASAETAIGVGSRVWYTEDDLWRGVKNELWDEEDVEALLKATPETPQLDDETKGGDISRTSMAGTEDNTGYDREDRAFEFFEVIWKYDGDKDHIKEDCLFLVEMSTGILLRYEQYPYWHGRRNYITWTPYPRPKSAYGYSVPEILEDLAAEINAIRNQRVDAGTLALMPMMLKRRGTKFDSTRQRLRPGIVIECDNPETDIRPFSFQNLTQSAFAEEQHAAEQAESVTGATAYAAGQSPSRSRTLGEISGGLTEANVRFEVLIARLHKANNEVARQIVGLNQQYLDANTEFSITNDAGARVFQSVTRQEMRTRVRIFAHGNTLNSNKELALQSKETLYQMMANVPFMQKPTRMWAVMASYLREMGMPDVTPYIGTEKEAEDLEQQQASAPPAPPPPPGVTGKMDEVGTLALMFKEKQITPEEYQQTAQMMASGGTMPSNVKAGALPKDMLPPPAAPPPPAFPPARRSASPLPPGYAQAV